MKLFEMKKLPEVFGTAKIEYDEKANVPRRVDTTIVLPRNGSTDLYTLMNGKQFLLTIQNMDNWGSSHFWFGGTDENPFLVEITGHPVKAFLEKGSEYLFYQLLQWKEVGLMESACKRPYKRQGDIFAVPLNIGWSRLVDAYRIASTPIIVKETQATSLFGTRHQLKGRIVDSSPVTIKGVGTKVVASGLITAPDHTDLNLGDWPHALYQTANLVEPLKAD